MVCRKKIIGFIVLFVVMGCAADHDRMSYEDAYQIAESRVRNDYNFKQYGTNLKIVESHESDNKHHFIFRYDVIDGPTGVVEAEVGLYVEDGKARNYSHTEITGVRSFDECVNMGYEIVEPDCEGCKTYCVTPDGKSFAEPDMCEDLCGDGNCDEIVCMAQGCPCPETPESCPEDC